MAPVDFVIIFVILEIEADAFVIGALSFIQKEDRQSWAKLYQNFMHLKTGRLD